MTASGYELGLELKGQGSDNMEDYNCDPLADSIIAVSELDMEESVINLVNGPLVVVDYKAFTIKDIDVMFLSQKMAESAVQYYGLDDVNDYVEMLVLGVNFDVEDDIELFYEKFISNN